MAGSIFAAVALLADAAVIGLTHSWPAAAPSAAVYVMLGIAWGLTLIAFLLLRSVGGEGGEPPPPDPEPPWWPEFERQFREYARGRVGRPGRRRAPVGAGGGRRPRV
jgi:hypothetical protein